MRVIAGEAKGRPLKGPRTSGTRPTSDRVREALFDILAPYVERARVLDLYAGTGALAIEALSRGADSADLVEADRTAQAVIADNLERTGLKSRARLWRMRVEKALPQLGPQYDVILADPPYADAHIQSVLAQLGSLIADEGLVAIEHATRVALPDAAPELRLWKRRRHGDTTLSLYKRVSRPERRENDA
ncbi:MAG TPA: 16S rRNA (guanine(966)-N(2))-methyltransferase RsmD [Chloroflexota bacterium]|nr:16S rRNA (guanine(966)-N(2))-methyltransferase RsmD [Chloroflexota bacterium]